MMMERTILGIDPGTGRLGWAILQQRPKLENGRGKIIELIKCGLIESKANTPLADRLLQIFNKLTEVIEEYKPTELAVEELFFVKNVKTGISVAHARGVILLCAKQKDLSISEYKPNEIKLGICGHGHADKKQIVRMLPLHLKGCKITQDDTADAVATGLYHLQVSR